MKMAEEILKERSKIYYINSQDYKVYDVDNLPIYDAVREHISNEFLKISYNRVEEIEKAYFMNKCFLLGDDENIFDDYYFRHYMEKFKQETNATTEEIKGFIRCVKNNGIDIAYTRDVMKNVRDTAINWTKKIDINGWFNSVYNMHNCMKTFIDDINRVADGIAKKTIINYGDDTYIQLKQTITQ